MGSCGQLKCFVAWECCGAIVDVCRRSRKCLAICVHAARCFSFGSQRLSFVFACFKGAVWHSVVWCVLSCTLAFALAGARASHYVQTALNPALEGRTLHVVGIVANLPQRTEDSARFRFEVECVDVDCA
jgi:predicted membrane metal-binding protein